MKILMLVTKYPGLQESTWLTSELANELATRGHSITVLNLEWGGGSDCIQEKNNIYHLRRNPYGSGKGLFGLVKKWLFSSFRLYPFIFNKLIRRERYDLTLAFSPCVSMWSVIPLIPVMSKKSHLIYWDFFPIHNYQISNKVPKIILPFLKTIERFLISTFERVSVMSEENLQFFYKYFGPATLKQKRDVIPIWTSLLVNPYRSLYREKVVKGSKNEEVLVVFGGQLTYGRGIENLLNAVVMSRKENPLIKLVICGDGELKYLVEDFLLSNPDAGFFLGQVTRDEYFKVLSVADVGVVATLENVECPTYPSKSLDYMASKLPILASIEENSDFGRIIERNGFGRSCVAGDLVSFNKLLLELSLDDTLRSSLGVAGYNYLIANHSVVSATTNILES